MTSPKLVDRRDVLAVIGIGDDGPTGLSPQAREIVQTAEVLCGGHRHLALCPEHPAERIVVTADLDGLVERLESELGRRRVVVLATGDPTFYGIGPLLARRLGQDRVEIIPHVSAVALAFARLRESWHDATVVSAHGRPLDDAIRNARGARKLAFLTDPTNTPGAIARALLAGSIDDAPASVFEHLGGTDERSFHASLADVAERTFADPNLLVVLRPTSRETDQLFGRAESEFAHRRGLVTKAEVRAVSLSKLALGPRATLWDVGAGCGSVAIEAAGLVPHGTVYAIERSAEQLELLRTNVARFRRADHVRIVPGEAPAALEPLPTPDSVFIGGSGGALEPILDAAYDRVRLSGRIVLNLATIEHLALAARWGAAHGMPADVAEIGVARGAPILGLTRLEAQNPVFMVTFER